MVASHVLLDGAGPAARNPTLTRITPLETPNKAVLQAGYGHVPGGSQLVKKPQCRIRNPRPDCRKPQR